METAARTLRGWSTLGNKVVIFVCVKTGQVATEFQRLSGVKTAVADL